MAEESGFWTTGGTVGDQQVSYTQAQWSTASRILSACSGFEGVAPGYLNRLEGTVTGANTVAINTGGGMVDGKWFYNSASQNVTIPSASALNTRIDRIVLRATWASFNVSVTRIAGTETTGTPSAPAITQTSGTTYDIKLYQALVDSAGTVTVTDERTFASHGLYYRQGNSSTIWNQTGTPSNYQPTEVAMQAGVITSSNSANVTVTFPRQFTNIPLVYITPYSTTTAGGSPVYPVITAYTSTAFTFSVYLADRTTRAAMPCNWLAIGPSPLTP